jgi:type IV secretory pathway VirB3-like protein
VGLFLLGCLMFSYPLITLFDRPVMVLGVPLLYAYLFGAWALIIALVALIVERRD